MNLILPAVLLVVAAFAFFATPKNSPLIKTGFGVAAAGLIIELISISVRLLFLYYGAVALIVAGCAIYFYGRYARKERFGIER